MCVRNRKCQSTRVNVNIPQTIAVSPKRKKSSDCLQTDALKFIYISHVSVKVASFNAYEPSLVLPNDAH